jgi:hypothetical protein
MKLNKAQLDILSRYFSDISKILVASTMLGFFVPTGVGPITITVFLVGSMIAIGFLVISVRLTK